MRCSALFASCLASAVLAATSAVAGPQADIPTLAPHVQELTCGPRTLAAGDDGAPRVLGGRDRESPGMFGPREVIVASAGDGTTLAAGQLYVAYRRARSRIWTGENDYVDQTAQNAGVVRIESVAGSRATAIIVWACDGVDVGDRLAPFVPATAPMPPSGSFPADPGAVTASLDGAAEVQLGQQDRRMGAARDLLLVSRVAGQDVVPGQRVAFFRRYQGKDGPASLLGEGVVQTVSEKTYVVQVVGSRDAIGAGDLVGAASR
jgi:hypothetical protein